MTEGSTASEEDLIRLMLDILVLVLNQTFGSHKVGLDHLLDEGIKVYFAFPS